VPIIDRSMPYLAILAGQLLRKSLLNIVTHKCLPILLYGTEVCPVSKSDTNSFDFAINRFLMKFFNTNDINIIEEFRVHFDVILPIAH